MSEEKKNEVMNQELDESELDSVAGGMNVENAAVNVRNSAFNARNAAVNARNSAVNAQNSAVNSSFTRGRNAAVQNNTRKRTNE